PRKSKRLIVALAALFLLVGGVAGAVLIAGPDMAKAWVGLGAAKESAQAAGETATTGSPSTAGSSTQSSTTPSTRATGTSSANGPTEGHTPKTVEKTPDAATPDALERRGLSGEKIYERLLKSTAVVVIMKDGEFQSNGTGFVVDAAEKLLVTNVHVVGDN